MTYLYRSNAIFIEMVYHKNLYTIVLWWVSPIISLKYLNDYNKVIICRKYTYKNIISNITEWSYNNNVPHKTVENLQSLIIIHNAYIAVAHKTQVNHQHA